VGVETIGGRCVELDAAKISLVSRAVAVVPSVTILVVTRDRSLFRFALSVLLLRCTDQSAREIVTLSIRFRSLLGVRSLEFDPDLPR